MLADKTDKTGARYYKIIAIVGNNKLHANAMTYQ
ncbi:hypothetical protein C2M07_01605 [Serratia marcescens]|nr:hypothetical protein C2M07_01605 [Serratia marcescens]